MPQSPLTSDDVFWIVCWAWVALAIWWILSRLSKRRANKNFAILLSERKAAAKVRRESISDHRRTLEDELDGQIDVARTYGLPGDIRELTSSRIVAQGFLDQDLGRLADEPISYHLTQETRDILLVNARRDAAEALLHTNFLLKELHGLKTKINNLVHQLVLFGGGILAYYWWKSNFVIWNWAKWWTWFQ